MSLWRTVRTRRGAVHLLACAITLYGALLRLDAFTGKYGALDRPTWARIATHDIAPLAARLRPSSVQWKYEPRPYVGGDPITYLTYAREMKEFYQPHVREPVFLAMTKAGLWALDDQDLGIGLASAVGSTLIIFATYLLGAAMLSPFAGLFGALVIAIEYEAITWAPDGWRDDTFTAAVVLAAWALLRLRQAPSFRRALLAGVLCGLAALTRITAISFIVPALLWLIVDGPRAERLNRARHAGIAMLVCAALVAPYLISCAIATGDPLIAINYHTSYYRHAEGRPISAPMPVTEYLRTRFVERPFGTLDTGLNGLFLQPFITKWHGLEGWISGFGTSLRWLALLGIAAMPFSSVGRLFLVILLSSLLPYIFTWNLGGGGEWRFTMHAYPFYIVAAVYAVAWPVRLIRAVAANPALVGRETLWQFAWRVSIVAAAAALGVVAYYSLPWLVTREAIAKGDSTSVETGPRDRVFYRNGWTPPHNDSITVRVSRGDRSVIRLPLPVKRDYEIVLRIDPVAPGLQERVNVLFNRHFVASLQLSWNPERVGSYRVPIRAQTVREGSNELIIIPDSVVTAHAAGPRFAWLHPAEKIGVRLWYVRVLP